MYTSEEEYLGFFSNETEAPSPYELNEDLAIIILEDYAFSFPTLEQYNELEEEYPKQCLRKAILCQIKYIEEHPEVFDRGNVGGSYSMGRISVNQGTTTVEDKEKMQISSYAEKYLNASGFVETGVYVERNCGCEIMELL